MAVSFLFPTAVGADASPARHPGPRRPELVVLHGGRSPRAVAVRRRYLWRRLFALALVVAVGWSGVALGSAVLARMGSGAGPVAELPATYQVRAGDTLWGIADRLAADADPRVVVDLLMEANGGMTTIQPGQALVVPDEIASI